VGSGLFNSLNKACLDVKRYPEITNFEKKKKRGSVQGKNEIVHMREQKGDPQIGKLRDRPALTYVSTTQTQHFFFSFHVPSRHRPSSFSNLFSSNFIRGTPPSN
jgi:hypothetical protein